MCAKATKSPPKNNLTFKLLIKYATCFTKYLPVFA